MSLARSAFNLTARSAARIGAVAPASSSRAVVARQSPVQLLQTRSVASAPNGTEFIHERKHIADHAAKSADLWRKISMFVCIPGAIVIGVYIYGIEAEHLHHRDHEIHENGGELPERVFYEYNNVRKRSFPWGQQSLFFNAKANYPAEEM
ncbi:Cytochrome c oxidase subunit 6A [Tilletia horrida]|uniref:Cytochrome c oxidase subunit 6A n=1 Tax=Tilletia horrida TaxID=155126 RepID=A0AAN6GMH8_9BASI|nr:Cytochrome c oxidase subunit 6A [Tilletia horrida]KAK0560996.1 Cytochrome c oxidase subunit 6A [Tilletia horrida]